MCAIWTDSFINRIMSVILPYVFSGLSGDRFKFDNNGDGPARYNIIHFKQVSLGKYRWVKVGEYVEGELRLNMSGEYECILFAGNAALLYPRWENPCNMWQMGSD